MVSLPFPRETLDFSKTVLPGRRQEGCFRDTHTCARRRETFGRGAMYSLDGFLVVCVSIAGSLFCELVSWVLIYRKQNYQNLVSSIRR